MIAKHCDRIIEAQLGFCETRRILVRADDVHDPYN